LQRELASREIAARGPVCVVSRRMSSESPASGPVLRPVLLIDDSHEDLFLTKRLLVRGGIKNPIVTVDGGEEALVFLRASTLPGARELMPCVILCDVRMPKVNGLEVLKWTRGQAALKETTFAILTGGDMPEDREAASRLGADHFLVKFPPVDTLRRIITTACSRS
jgi:two-component system, response regulator